MSEKFYVAWEAPNPFFQQEEEPGYQPPTWYVREFGNIADATVYYWQHRERGIDAYFFQDISSESLSEVWKRAVKP